MEQHGREKNFLARESSGRGQDLESSVPTKRLYYWGFIWTMEKKMETTIMGYIGFRV